jgi:hypothetical protein
VLRGGAWNNTTENCRAGYRNRNTPDNRNNNLGFRVVCCHIPGPGAAAGRDPSRPAGARQQRRQCVEIGRAHV